MPQITVIGLGICQPPLLNEQALNALRTCDCIMGSPRQLESVEQLCASSKPEPEPEPKSKPEPKPKLEPEPEPEPKSKPEPEPKSKPKPEPNPHQVRLALPKLAQIADDIKGFSHVVILASGDPLLFGIGKYLQSTFGPDTGYEVVCISGVSSLQGACELTGLSLEDAQLVSLHGRPLSHLNRHLQPHRNLLILTDKHSHPQAIACALVAANLPHSVIHVCERLGYEDQNCQQFEAQTLAQSTASFDPLHVSFDPLHVTVVRTLGGGNVMPSFPGIEDAHFVTDGESGKGLLTKREVRLNILSLLQPSPQDTAWDIGAGCGGVAIEWALWNPLGRVYGIEHHQQRVACLNANIEAFGVSANLHLIQGRAPACLTDLPPPDKVFIGGSGGQLRAILQLAWQRLKPGGRLVTSAVTEPSKATLRDFSKLIGQQPQHYLQVAISRQDTIAGQDILRPALPITLMSWHKTPEICQ